MTDYATTASIDAALRESPMLQRYATERALDTLAANLRVAGALCAAWRDGAAWGEWFGDPCTSLLDRPWSPGCNRPAPGVG
jgi:hypothetical protein